MVESGMPSGSSKDTSGKQERQAQFFHTFPFFGCVSFLAFHQLWCPAASGLTVSLKILCALQLNGIWETQWNSGVWKWMNMGTVAIYRVYLVESVEFAIHPAMISNSFKLKAQATRKCLHQAAPDSWTSRLMPSLCAQAQCKSSGAFH